MNALPALRAQPTPADVRAWLGELRARYDRLAARASSLQERADMARLGVKLSELLTLARASTVCERDAALLPRLACWVEARIEALESGPAIRPLTLPPPPPPDARRAAALAEAIVFFGDRFGMAPGPIARRRLDILLARYPLAGVLAALDSCARREGAIRWPLVEGILADGASLPVR